MRIHEANHFWNSFDPTLAMPQRLLRGLGAADAGALLWALRLGGATASGRGPFAASVPHWRAGAKKSSRAMMFVLWICERW